MHHASASSRFPGGPGGENALLGHGLDDRGQARARLDRDDVGAGHLHVVHGAITQVEDVGEQPPFVLVDGDLGFLALLDKFFQDIARRVLSLRGPAKPLEPTAQGILED